MNKTYDRLMSEVWEYFGEDDYVPLEEDMGTPEQWEQVERDPELFEQLREAFNLPPKRK